MLLLLPAGADAALKAFRSPSGKIGCMYVRDARNPAFVRCDWLGGDCAVTVGKTGKGRRIRVTDTVMDPAAPALAYTGTRRFRGGLACTSRRTGMTCENRGGHGFTVSVERRKVF